MEVLCKQFNIHNSSSGLKDNMQDNMQDNVFCSVKWGHDPVRTLKCLDLKYNTGHVTDLVFGENIDKRCSKPDLFFHEEQNIQTFSLELIAQIDPSHLDRQSLEGENIRY